MGLKFETAMQEIGNSLSIAISEMRPISLMYGEVISVDMNANTFDISTLEDSEIRDIPLTGVQGAETSVLVTPSIGSLVVVGFVQNDPSLTFPILFTQLDKADITIKNSTVSITGDKIVLNGGDSPLIYIEQLTSKLNDLVSTVNDIISTFNKHSHIVPQGTSGMPSQKITGTANNFDETDYQDEKIMH